MRVEEREARRDTELEHSKQGCGPKEEERERF